jgi:hypothetical protein
VSQSRSFDEPDDKQEDYGADGRYDETAQQSTTGIKSQGSKEKAPENRTDDTYDYVAYDAESPAPHELTRKPSGSEPYQYEPEKFQGNLL